MIKKKIRSYVRFSILFLLTVISLRAFSQNETPPFWKEVQAFKKQDSIAAPATGQVLFIGSSSFTYWTKAQQDFPNHKILNRAFGGSSFPDLIRFADVVIYPYKPKQIVIYCGDNDLAASDTVSPELVFERFKTLFTMMRTKLPGVAVAFVAIKPSPSRERLMPKANLANSWIRDFLAKEKNTAFIDVYHAMLRDGKPMPEIFREDNLHMNEKGYVIWQKLMEPYLLK